MERNDILEGAAIAFEDGTIEGLMVCKMVREGKACVLGALLFASGVSWDDLKDPDSARFYSMCDPVDAGVNPLTQAVQAVAKVVPIEFEYDERDGPVERVYSFSDRRALDSWEVVKPQVVRVLRQAKEV